MNINQSLLEEIYPKFKDFLDNESEEWNAERKEKDEFLHKYFFTDEINKIDEGTIRELVHKLWANNMWTNKDNLHNDMLKTGLQNIIEAFRVLFDNEKPIAERFDHVKQNIRRMGASSISEILAHYDHNKYPIWNSKIKQGLITLGVPVSKLPKSSQISGKQYESFCKLYANIHDEISTKYKDISDFFILDHLIYFLSTHENVSVSIDNDEELKEVKDFDHDEMIDNLLELGDGLGFDVQKEFYVMRGCRLDAIWRSRVANLGTISYAFEVHRHGSRDSAILNLQRVRRDPSIQKVIIVTTAEEIEIFKGEILSLDESFRHSVGYFDVRDVLKALSYIQELKTILKDLGLLSIDNLIDT